MDTTPNLKVTMEEVEVKFLDINVEEIETKLKRIGATKQFDKLYKRKVFDYPDLRLNDAGAWIRVRDEGEQVTLSFKQRKGTSSHDGATNDQSMEEIELVVSDFARMATFFERIGLKQKFYEENRRVRWTKDDLEFDIDYWPELNPYLEIEAKSWEKIDEAIALLGLNPTDKKIFSTFQIYQLAGINELDYSEVTFNGMVKK
ncbi:MAG: adenylyl cyclase [Patescibacteria group bacterium]|jgi:adenylate cyclase class 2|nr:adenylyl cyclase [Patescibacteria group bacterium]